MRVAVHAPVRVPVCLVVFLYLLTNFARTIIIIIIIKNVTPGVGGKPRCVPRGDAVWEKKMSKMSPELVWSEGDFHVCAVKHRCSSGKVGGGKTLGERSKADGEAAAAAAVSRSLIPLSAVFQTNYCHRRTRERELMRGARLWSVRAQSGEGR